MEFSTNLGATSLRLRTVICIYEDGTGTWRSGADDVPRQVASIHDVLQTESAPVLAPGRPASLSAIRRFKEGLGQSQAATYLPPHILAYAPESMLWHVPAAPRPIFWETKNEALNAISGDTLPCPPLIFRAQGETPRRMGLSVWAYKPEDTEDGRPVPSTPLYNAPFFNVSSTGSVCLGSMRRPESHSPEAARVWEASFFKSRFTHPNGSKLLSGLPTYADTIIQLTGQPDRDDAGFPMNRLVPADRTLADVIE